MVKNRSVVVVSRRPRRNRGLQINKVLLKRVINKLTPVVSKTARKRRRRRTRRAKPYSDDFSVLPTTAQREASLRMPLQPRRSRPNFNSEWAMCRMNPMDNMGSSNGKPDGRNTNRMIVIDHPVLDTILVTGPGGVGQNFSVLFLPGLLPFSGLVGSGATAGQSNITVNGIPHTSNGGLQSALYPIGIPNEWANTYAQLQVWSSGPSPRNDPYDSMRGRVISVGRRISFRGNITNDQGWVNVAPFPFASKKTPVYANSDNPTIASQLGVRGFNPALIAGQYFNITTPMRLVDFSAATNTLSGQLYNKQTQMFRLDRSFDIVSKQQGDVHDYYPIPDMGDLLIANQSGIASNGAPVSYTPWNCDPVGVAGNAFPAAVWLFDESWTGEILTFNQVLPNTLITIESVLCIEYQVATSSSFAPLAREGPKPQPMLVSSVNEMVNKSDVAKPTFSKGSSEMMQASHASSFSFV